MTQCPMCGAECDSNETCPACGARLEKHPSRTDDADILAKDRWTFGEVGRDAPAQSTKPGLGRDPTQVMHQLREPTPPSVEKIESTTKTKAGIGHEPTLTLGSLKDAAPSKKEPEPDQTPSTMAGLGPSTQALHKFKEQTSKVSDTKPTIIGMSPLNIPSNTLPIPLSPSSPPPKEVKPPTEQERVNVEPRTVSAKATSPMEVRIAPPSTRNRSASLRGRGKPSQNTDKLELQVALAVSSAILVLVWFVPDVWNMNPISPYKLLGSVHGTDLVALLACPTLGAVLLALLIAPISPASKAVPALVAGLAALAVPLLMSTPPLPLQGNIIILTAVVNIAGAVVIFIHTEYKIFGHLALILVPGTLMGIAILGIVTGKLPLAQISALKAPLTIYGAMLASSVAASVLIQSVRRQSQQG